MRSSQARRAVLAEQNRSQPAALAPIPRDQWPPQRPGAPFPIEAFRSREFLVQIFDEPSGLRMSVNRTALKGFRDGQPLWRDGISWDELQRLKAEAGYADRWAVECYPPESEIVNVANLRHLWLLPEAPAYGWQRGRL